MDFCCDFLKFFYNQQFVFQPMKATSIATKQTDFPKQKSKSPSHFAIDQRFYIISLKGRHSLYNLYKGVDTSKAKQVHIYVKQEQSECSFLLSKGTKEHLRNQICPKVIWSGDVVIQNGHYSVEVHEKFGPSLQNIFDRIGRGPNELELLHLLLQIIKLIQKMYSLRLVSGELDPNNIVFDQNPKKNQLYLLNSFTIKKKNTEAKPMLGKYCSRGAHLGRNLGIKDDLESACYILIDLFTCGHFLQNKTSSQCQQEKLSLKVQNFADGLPKAFIDFYNYVINLNCGDQINFFNWKSYLTRILTNEVTSQPFGFLLVKDNGNRHMTQQIKPKIQQQDDFISDMMEVCEDDIQGKEKHLLKVNREIPNHLKFKAQLF